MYRQQVCSFLDVTTLSSGKLSFVPSFSLIFRFYVELTVRVQVGIVITIAVGNKKLSYRKQTVRLLRNTEIRVLH